MASASGQRGSLGRPPRTLGTRPAIAATVAVLVVANLVENRWAPGWGLTPGWSFVIGPVVAALLLGVFRWSGGTWAEVGLGRNSFGRVARWALVLIGIVAAVYLIGALLEITRDLFNDRRTSGLSGLQVADRMLVRVPLGVVLLEETAFRGVLFALLLRGYDRMRAAVFSSVLFGLWHVLPSLHMPTDRPTGVHQACRQRRARRVRDRRWRRAAHGRRRRAAVRAALAKQESARADGIALSHPRPGISGRIAARPRNGKSARREMWTSALRIAQYASLRAFSANPS